MKSVSTRAALLSLILLGVFVLIWHLATIPKEAAQAADSEYAKLMGAGAPKSSGLPTPLQIGDTIWKHAKDPFYDNGPNDKGIGVQVAYSLARVMSGFLLAALVAIPLGFLIGMSIRLFKC
jgi:nitrate/nitrite transport system permease protein